MTQRDSEENSVEVYLSVGVTGFIMCTCVTHLKS